MGIRLLPSGRFRLQIRRAGLAINEVHDTREAAEAAQAQYLGPGANAADKRRRKANGVTVDEAWALYRNSRTFIEHRPNTQRSEDTHVKPVLVRLGTRPVKSLTADDVDDFIVRETKAGKAPDTVRNAVAALSSILNFCRSKAMVTANVTIGVKRPVSPPQVRRMPQGHQGALMKALNHPKYRYRAVARLALLVRETGARPGEWARAKWDWVHFDQQKIVFEETKYKRQPRTVPITQAAMALLMAQMEDVVLANFDTLSASEWVFPTVGRDSELRPIAYTGTLRDMKKDELLPRGLRAHSGRHEFISSLVESSDLDDSRIMSIVGHHSPASMQIYTHARNVRFLPQLEALEESRRKERTAELGKALGVPPKLIEAYLEHRRATDDTESDEAGNEILYEGEAIEKLSAVAARLGTSDSERMRTLVEIQKKAAQRAEGTKRTPSEAGPTQPLPAKTARKRPVASTGATGRQRSSAKAANKAR
jgi:integrase